MEIDTSQVFTDEHRDAITRLAASNLTRAEFEKILQQLPERATSLSKEQYERIEQLESEDRIEEALAEGISTVFALKVAEASIYGRIHGRLAGVDNLPDKMEELERMALTEMGSEVAYIESALADTFPLPTRELVRLYTSILSDKYESLEKEFNLLRKTKERKKALGISDVAKGEYELTREEKLLAKICPLFRNATPQIQQNMWNKLRGSTRNQWALFFIEADPKSKTYPSKTAAVKEIIKPIVKTIEEISGRTNMRSISIMEGSRQYTKDLKKVKEIINILKADAVLLKNQFVTPNRNVTEF